MQEILRFSKVDKINHLTKEQSSGGNSFPIFFSYLVCSLTHNQCYDFIRTFLLLRKSYYYIFVFKLNLFSSLCHITGLDEANHCGGLVILI